MKQEWEEIQNKFLKIINKNLVNKLNSSLAVTKEKSQETGWINPEGITEWERKNRDLEKREKYVHSNSNNRSRRKGRREDGGRVGGPQAHFIPWIQLDNTHDSINNPENDPKTDRGNYTNKGREEATLKNVAIPGRSLMRKQTMTIIIGRIPQSWGRVSKDYHTEVPHGEDNFP